MTSRRKKIFYSLLIIIAVFLIFAEFFLQEFAYLIDLSSGNIKFRKANISLVSRKAVISDLKYKYGVFNLFCEKLLLNFSLIAKNRKFLVFNFVSAEKFQINSDNVSSVFLPLYPIFRMPKIDIDFRTVVFKDGTIIVNPADMGKIQFENCRGFFSFNILGGNELVQNFSSSILPDSKIKFGAIRYFDNDSIVLRLKLSDYKNIDAFRINMRGCGNDYEGTADIDLKSNESFNCGFDVFVHKNKNVDIRKLNVKSDKTETEAVAKLIFLPDDKIKFRNLRGNCKIYTDYKGANIFSKTVSRELNGGIEYNLNGIWDAKSKKTQNLKGVIKSAYFNFDMSCDMLYGERISGDMRLYSQHVDPKAIEGADQYFHFGNEKVSLDDVSIELDFYGMQFKFKKAVMKFIDGTLTISHPDKLVIDAQNLSSEKLMRLIYPPYDKVSGKIFSKFGVDQNQYSGTLEIRDGTIKNVNLLSKVRKNMPSNIVMDKILDLIEKQSLVFSSTPFKTLQFEFNYDGAVLFLKKAKMDCKGYQLKISELKIKGDRIEGSGVLHLDPLFPIKTVTGLLDKLTLDFFSMESFVADFPGKIGLIPFDVSGTLSTPQFKYFKYGNMLEKYYKK